MTDRGFVIPAHRLPPGFAQRLETPPDPPVPARPAATTVLLRDGHAGVEVLLLRRHRDSGFVPGAYVFPGGRVDADDEALALRAAAALPAEPAPAFRAAAVRELFEETAVLLAHAGTGAAWPHAGALLVSRATLLAGERTFAQILSDARVAPDLAGLVHCAHWITPAAEPRRYDTHFFLAALPADAEVHVNPREITDARWLAPATALAHFTAGALPMVFPTVKTIEALVGYRSVAQALDAFRGRAVETIQPRLVRAGAGVAIVVDAAERKDEA